MNEKQIRLRSREEVQDFVGQLVTVILILIFPMTA